MTLPSSSIAMLCEGTEVYGIGTIQKIYAQSCSDMLFVCMRDGPMLHWLKEHRARVIELPLLASIVAGGSLSTLLRLPGLLRKAREDVEKADPIFRKEGIRLVHTHWLPQQLLGRSFRSLGYKVAWQINNLISSTRLMGMGQKLNHLFAHRGADVLLPASDFIAHQWAGSGVPMKTVRNAAIPVHTRPSALADSPVRCVVAGRLEESKGHHIAAGAVILARQAGFDVSLDMFGGPVMDNPYAEAILARANSAGAAGAIRALGFVNDLRHRHPQYHIGMQCRIDPEPCSLWVCETLVDGLPLLASANGGTPELVYDGTTGLLYRSGDEKDLADKLIELLKNPQRLAGMRLAAFERGQSMFTPDRFIRETFEAYAMAERE